MSAGVTSVNLEEKATADSLLANKDGSTGQISVDNLAVQMTGSGPLAARVNDLESQITSGLLSVSTWADLVALAGAAEGAGAEVLDTDTGTHSAATATGYDGTSVSNAGRYSWNAAWSRWVRIGNTGLAGKANLADLAAVATSGDSDDLTEGTAKLLMTPAERAKIGGIESGATGDMTGAEIKAAYEAEADTNALTDALLAKLGTLRSDGQIWELVSVAGTADAHTANRSTEHAAAAWTLGQVILWKAPVGPNTGALTLSVDGQAAVPVVRSDLAQMQTGDIGNNDWLLAVVQAVSGGLPTQFRMVMPVRGQVLSEAELTKLTNIEAGATANDTNAALRDRSTHTGVQDIATITGLQTALDGKATAAQGDIAESALQPVDAATPHALTRWSQTKTGPLSSRPALAIGVPVDNPAFGPALAVTDADVPTTPGYVDISANRIFHLDATQIGVIRAKLQRILPPSDPLSATVQVIVQPLTGGLAALPEQIIYNPAIPPAVADGPVEIAFSISRDSGADVTLNPAAAAFGVFFRVYSDSGQIDLGPFTWSADAYTPEDRAAAAALDAAAVRITGDQGISGVKTFSTPPVVVSDAAAPDELPRLSQVQALLASLVDSAPGSLDTLNELAAALGDDPNFATTTVTLIGEKLAKAANLSDLANAPAARANIGLGNVDNTADVNKPVSTAQQDALNLKGDGAALRSMFQDLGLRDSATGYLLSFVKDGRLLAGIADDAALQVRDLTFMGNDPEQRRITGAPFDFAIGSDDGAYLAIDRGKVSLALDAILSPDQRSTGSPFDLAFGREGGGVPLAIYRDGTVHANLAQVPMTEFPSGLQASNLRRYYGDVEYIIGQVSDRGHVYDARRNVTGQATEAAVIQHPSPMLGRIGYGQSTMGQSGDDPAIDPIPRRPFPGRVHGAEPRTGLRQ